MVEDSAQKGGREKLRESTHDLWIFSISCKNICTWTVYMICICTVKTYRQIVYGKREPVNDLYKFIHTNCKVRVCTYDSYVYIRQNALYLYIQTHSSYWYIHVNLHIRTLNIEWIHILNNCYSLYIRIIHTIRTAWCVVNVFYKNGMKPLIIANGTICYSILYCNSPRLYIRTKYMYSVISVKLVWLPCNTIKWTID